MSDEPLWRTVKSAGLEQCHREWLVEYVVESIEEGW